MLIKIYPIQITDFKSDRRYTVFICLYVQNFRNEKNDNLARSRIFTLYDQNDNYYDLSSFVNELTSNYNSEDAL